MAEKYLVEGYEFDTLEAANDAKKELEAVKFMSQKTNGCSPEMAYKVYTKIVDNNLFHTEIGLDYLRALEEFLMMNGMFDVPSVDEVGYTQDGATTDFAGMDPANTIGDDLEVNQVTDESVDDEIEEVAQKNGKEKKVREKKIKEPKVKEPKVKEHKEKTAKKEKVRRKPTGDESAQLKKIKDLLVSSLILNAFLVIGIIIMMYIASTSSNVNILNYETALQDKYSSWSEELKTKENAIKEREKAVKQREKDADEREKVLDERESESTSGAVINGVIY